MNCEDILGELVDCVAFCKNHCHIITMLLLFFLVFCLGYEVSGQSTLLWCGNSTCSDDPTIMKLADYMNLMKAGFEARQQSTDETIKLLEVKVAILEQLLEIKHGSTTKQPGVSLNVDDHEVSTTSPPSRRSTT